MTPVRLKQTSGRLKVRVRGDDLGLLDPQPLGDLLQVFLPQQVEAGVTVILGHLGGRPRLFGVPVDPLFARVRVCDDVVELFFADGVQDRFRGPDSHSGCLVRLETLHEAHVGKHFVAGDEAKSLFVFKPLDFRVA